MAAFSGLVQPQAISQTIHDKLPDWNVAFTNGGADRLQVNEIVYLSAQNEVQRITDPQTQRPFGQVVIAGDASTKATVRPFFERAVKAKVITTPTTVGAYANQTGYDSTEEIIEATVTSTTGDMVVLMAGSDTAAGDVGLFYVLPQPITL